MCFLRFRCGAMNRAAAQNRVSGAALNAAANNRKYFPPPSELIWHTEPSSGVSGWPPKVILAWLCIAECPFFLIRQDEFVHRYPSCGQFVWCNMT